MLIFESDPSINAGQLVIPYGPNFYLGSSQGSLYTGCIIPTITDRNTSKDSVSRLGISSYDLPNTYLHEFLTNCPKCTEVKRIDV